jgi:hypothetical protein
MYLNNWDIRKQDPTFYDNELKTIFVRPDYSKDEDSYGWIVHEKIHAYLASINFKDNYNPPLVEYPYNEVERYAFTWQFVFLLETKKIRSIDDIERIMLWKFDRFGDEWANKYFKDAQTYARDCDPSRPPSTIVLSGSSLDQQLEDVFRNIVNDAKRKSCAINDFRPKAYATQEKSEVSKQNNLFYLRAVITIIFLIAIAVVLSL